YKNLFIKGESYPRRINMEKAIFLDKDGTLILDVPYNVNPSLVTLTKHAIEGLQKLSKAGFRFYLISNQQGISLGYFTANDLIPIRKKLENIFLTHGITLNDFYFCPHGDKDSCFCRKPQPGLILQAAKDHQVDLKHSWMIGDSASDIQAGKKA